MFEVTRAQALTLVIKFNFINNMLLDETPLSFKSFKAYDDKYFKQEISA